MLAAAHVIRPCRYFSRSFACIRNYSSAFNLIERRKTQNIKDGLIIDKLEDTYEKIAKNYKVALDEIEGRNRTESSVVQLDDSRHSVLDETRLRIVPQMRSFFMGNPLHEEVISTLKDLLNKSINLPTIRDSDYIAPQWVNFTEYSANHGQEKVKPKHHSELVTLLNRLAKIDPQFTTPEVSSAIKMYQKAGSVASKRSSVAIAKQTLDEAGRAVAIGKRKTATCKAYVTRQVDAAKGQILVNGRAMDAYFPNYEDRVEITYPLKVIDAFENFNIFAMVRGGGKPSQAKAVSLAISKAILAHNPLLKTKLKKSGCLKRDLRVKERKKPGKLGARRSKTWVKR